MERCLVSTRYVDQDQLQILLESTFGSAGDYRVKVGHTFDLQAH